MNTPAGNYGRAMVMVLLLMLAAAGAWWYFAPGSLPGLLKAFIPPPAHKSAPTLYEWHDAKGRMNITDTPPTDRPYKTLHLDPNANVLPAGVAPSK